MMLSGGRWNKQWLATRDCRRRRRGRRSRRKKLSDEPSVDFITIKIQAASPVHVLAVWQYFYHQSAKRPQGKTQDPKKAKTPSSPKYLTKPWQALGRARVFGYKDLGLNTSDSALEDN